MSGDRPADYLASLVRELCALPRETEWVEFKIDEAEPQAIGEYISALANAAALVGKAFAYLVWGVRDEDHAIVGTTFDPHSARAGNEELESWLLRLLEPKIDFRLFTVEMDGCRVVLLEITRAARHPVRFSGQKFIRVGTYKKKLKDFPEKERALWRIFDQTPFEDGVATERAAGDDVLRLLDYPAYFDLLERPLPANREDILDALADDRLIRRSEAGGWDITHLGTVLFAHKPLSAMDKTDRVRACYLHACLRYVTRREMTNTTLRARFGVEEHNRAVVSRLIREAVEAGVVVPVDPDAAPKLMRYLPFWAASPKEGRA